MTHQQHYCSPLISFTRSPFNINLCILLFLLPRLCSGSFQDVLFTDTISTGALDNVISVGYLSLLSACQRSRARFVAARTGTIEELEMYMDRDDADTGFTFHITLYNDVAGSPTSPVQGSATAGPFNSTQYPFSGGYHSTAIDFSLSWNVTASVAYWLVLQSTDPLATVSNSISFGYNLYPTPGIVNTETQTTMTGINCSAPDMAYSTPASPIETQLLMRIRGIGNALATSSATPSASATQSPSATSSGSSSASPSPSNSSAPIITLTATATATKKSSSATPVDDTTTPAAVGASLCFLVVLGCVCFYRRNMNDSGGPSKQIGSSAMAATKGLMTAAQIAQVVAAAPVNLYDDDDPNHRERFKNIKRGSSSRSQRVSRAFGEDLAPPPPSNFPPARQNVRSSSMTRTYSSYANASGPTKDWGAHV